MGDDQYEDLTCGDKGTAEDARRPHRRLKSCAKLITKFELGFDVQEMGECFALVWRDSIEGVDENCGILVTLPTAEETFAFIHGWTLALSH